MKKIVVYALLLSMSAVSVQAMFCENDPVNNVDPLGLEAYLVYREFDSAWLKYGYLWGTWGGIGHFYLAFDGENVDKVAWGKLVTKLGSQKTPIRRDENPTAETFSFHPREVLDAQLGITKHKESIAGPFYTTSSFIGYNDRETDIEPFLNAKSGGIPGAAKATLFKLATTQEQQFDLYRKVNEMRVQINVENKNVFGTYKVLNNNCGSWAVTMAQSQGIDIPIGVFQREAFGAGLGGIQDYLPLTYAITYSAAGAGYAYRGGKTAVVAAGQGIYWTGNKAKEFVESTGGEFCVVPIENDRGGAIAAGIRWNF